MPVIPDDAIPEEIFEQPTRPIRISPYTVDEKCVCGAVIEGVDPKGLRVIGIGGHIRIVRCPMCPR